MIIVGVDGSAGSEQALAWSVHKSSVFGAVTPVMVHQPPVRLRLSSSLDRRQDLAILREAAEVELSRIVAAAGPGPSERARLIEGNPGRALAEVARDADLLVVGASGRNSLSRNLLGSVSAYCALHSPVPLAVIPLHFPVDRPVSNIVVGIDGSAGSRAALRWAVDHVATDGIVFAAGALSAWGYTERAYEPTPEVMEDQIRETVESTVRNVTAEVGGGGPEIRIWTAGQDARLALRQLAGTKADMLVVGARGVTGIPYLILGSVSTALVDHPLVPTVVIPAPPDTEGM